MSISVAGFDHVAIHVHDLHRSSQWYCTHLGMEVASTNDHHTFLRMSSGQVLALFPISDTHPATGGLHHLAFSLNGADVEQALQDIRAQDIETTAFGPSEGFTDPDGHHIHFV
ncbi:MAG: VOC family protein [Planctomycetes bacterium]|nr:VOC family protein [Planctomycetota bacterium]